MLVVTDKYYNQADSVEQQTTERTKQKCSNYFETEKFEMKIQKTEAEYNMKSIRFLLLTITTMFIFVSVLMIILGITVYSRYHDLSFLYESAKNGRFFTPSIMVVILGMMMLIVTSFGFFGSLKESTCMVNSYAAIIFLVMIVELAIVIIAFTIDPEQIRNYINIPVQYYASDSEIQQEIDFLQSSLNCCGSTSYTDYENVQFNENHLTVIWRHGTQELELPVTCCTDNRLGICHRVRQNNCTNAIVNMILQNTSVLGVLGVSVLFIQVLGITFSLLLARAIRKLKSERGLRRWNERERMIFEREAHKAKQNSISWIDRTGSTEA